MNGFRIPPPDGMPDLLQELARHVQDRVPPGYGFGVFIFQFGDPPGAMFWVSNGERGDMCNALSEFIRQEGH